MFSIASGPGMNETPAKTKTFGNPMIILISFSHLAALIDQFYAAANTGTQRTRVLHKYLAFFRSQFIYMCNIRLENNAVAQLRRPAKMAWAPQIIIPLIASSPKNNEIVNAVQQARQCERASFSNIAPRPYRFILINDSGEARDERIFSNWTGTDCSFQKYHPNIKRSDRSYRQVSSS